jgi:hypothetical protein
MNNQIGEIVTGLMGSSGSIVPGVFIALAYIALAVIPALVAGNRGRGPGWWVLCGLLFTPLFTWPLMILLALFVPAAEE